MSPTSVSKHFAMAGHIWSHLNRSPLAISYSSPSPLGAWLANAEGLVGTRLAMLLREAQFADVATIGVQDYHGPRDPRPAAMFAGATRSMAPALIGAGVATEDELGLDTLQDRLERAQVAADAVVLPPTLVAAWGLSPGANSPARWGAKSHLGATVQSLGARTADGGPLVSAVKDQ